MEIACFYLSNFPLQVESQRRPVLRGKQVIVVYSPVPDRPEVLDFSPGMKGLQAGMPFQEALSHSKGAVLVEGDVPYYYEIFERVLKALGKCSPSVEGADLGCAYVDLTGLEKLYGGREGLKKALIECIPPPFIARVGIGRGKFPARAVISVEQSSSQAVEQSVTVGSRQSAVEQNVAATLAVAEKDRSRTLHVPGGVGAGLVGAGLQPAGVACGIREVGEDVADFLRECDVNILPVPWKTKMRLHDFGLHTLGQVASLPLGPLQAQFGPEGKKIWELSRGIDNRPLIPRGSEETVTVHLSFPEASASQGMLLIAVENLLRRAFVRPELHDRYARGVVVQSQVAGGASWERRITFREPVGDKKRVLFIIKSALDGASLPGPLEDLRLTLFGLTGEVGRQESFFSEVRCREQLGDALRQLETRLGKAPPLYQVRDLEPWSKIPERRQALVRFSP